MDTPANIEPFVEVLGESDAIRFLLAFGGTSVYLALNPQSGSEVASAFGVEATKKLAAATGGGHVRVPTAKRWIAQRMKLGGDSVYKIARTLHVSVVSVRKWAKDEPWGQTEMDFDTISKSINGPSAKR